MHVSGGRAEAYAGKLGFTLKNPIAAIGIHEEIIHLFASLYALVQPSRDENRLLIMRACAEHILALMGVLPRLERKPSQSYREVQSIVPFMEVSFPGPQSLLAGFCRSPGHVALSFLAGVQAGHGCLTRTLPQPRFQFPPRRALCRGPSPVGRPPRVAIVTPWMTQP